MKKLQKGLLRVPAVAILGPRQVGKTTLAFQVAQLRDSAYLDLESPIDASKLQDPTTYLERQAGKLVVLDEVQRVPELFQALRGVIDQGRRRGDGNGQFLILGSASQDLLKQSSESLAGRIRYLELTGLTALEVVADNAVTLDRLWLRGGFPESYLSQSDEESAEWREDFIRTYLERDVPQLSAKIPSTTLRRLWVMLSHIQGGLLNASRLARSLGVSSVTVGRYLDLLVDLFLVRRLPPWHTNTAKRLVKSPKVYVRDSGLVHQLLRIPTFDDLLSHPVVGGSWEGFVIENILAVSPREVDAFFYRSSGGAEIDLLLELPGQQRWAVEVKRSFAPKPGRGFHDACREVQPTHKFFVYPGSETIPLRDNITAMGLFDFLRLLADF